MFSIITREKIKTHTIYLVAKKIALSDKNSYLIMLYITLIMPWCFLTGCLYFYLFILYSKWKPRTTTTSNYSCWTHLSL